MKACVTHLAFDNLVQGASSLLEYSFNVLGTASCLFRNAALNQVAFAVRRYLTRDIDGVAGLDCLRLQAQVRVDSVR